MWSALGSVLSGLGSVISPIIGGFSAKSAYDQQQNINQQQMGFAREQMAWQEEMSKTAHQREVKDLRKAGLNPILSAKYGGASTGSPVGLPNLQNPMNRAIEAMQSAKMVADIGLVSAMSRTEATKQVKNLVEADKATGGLVWPINIPFKSLPKGVKALNDWRVKVNKRIPFLGSVDDWSAKQLRKFGVIK